MKNSSIKMLLAGGIAGLLLSGCGGGGPKPSQDGKKPTVFVQSSTSKRLAGLTEEMAIWNNIEPQFAKNNQYMRCDMTEEAIVTIAKKGLDVVSNPKDADYTLDIDMLSCGYRFIGFNMDEADMEAHSKISQRALYKDFMKWVNETPSNELPSDAKEIARLISQNNPEGFKRFHNEDYLRKYGQEFDYSENWGLNNMAAIGYMKKTDGVLLPNKYAKIPKEDQKILNELHQKYKADAVETDIDSSIAGWQLVTQGAIAGGKVGGIGIGLGVLKMFSGERAPTPVNKITITNNKTGKSWSKITKFYISPQSWQSNTAKPMNDWTIDEIPWSDLN